MCVFKYGNLNFQIYSNYQLISLQMSAKQQAEKRFKLVLQKEGVSEDEITQLISMAESESRKSSTKDDR